MKKKSKLTRQSPRKDRRVVSPHWRQGIVRFVRKIEQKHSYTEGHSQRVRKLVKALGGALQWDAYHLRCASVAALLHDVGKIMVDNSTLNNQSTTLTDEQSEELIGHPQAGAKLVARMFSEEVTLGIAQHHERWDGRKDGPHHGYPLGLKGARISKIARAIAIADAYDAMTTKRAYNKPMTKAAAVQRLLAEAGGHFDPKMVRVFVRKVVPKIKVRVAKPR